jgi:hypothetical protein
MTPEDKAVVVGRCKSDMAKLAAKLEPLVGHIISLLDQNPGVASDPVWFAQMVKSGKWAFAMALDCASICAASNDPKSIIANHELAMLWLQQAERYQAIYKARERGRRGGNVTGPRQRASGRQTSEHVFLLYQAEIRAGRKPADAKRIVAEKLHLSDETVRKIVGVSKKHKIRQ